MTDNTDTQPTLGEVWEDAEGTLYTIANPNGELAWAFGTHRPIHLDHDEKVVQPLRRLFLEDGNFDTDTVPDVASFRLRYPQGHNVDRPEDQSWQ